MPPGKKWKSILTGGVSMSQTDAFLCGGLVWAISVMILAALVYKIQVEPIIKRRNKD